MVMEFAIANDPMDEGDGKGFGFLVKGFDPALPAKHDAGSAHGKSVRLFITGAWTTKAELEALLKVQMDKAPVLVAAVAEVKDGGGKVTTPAVAEVLGKSPRQVLAAWIAKQIGKPAVKVAKLPTRGVTRTVMEKDGEGKETPREVTVQIEDRKVTL